MKPISRVTLSQTATSTLRQLSAKTGLSPNILARFAMLVSFEQPNAPADDAGQPDLTIHQHSLFGDLEPFLLTAFNSRLPQPSSDAQKARILAAHIARGAAYLSVRVSSIVDLARLAQS